jgi:hypothetical protein
MQITSEQVRWFRLQRSGLMEPFGGRRCFRLAGCGGGCARAVRQQAQAMSQFFALPLHDLQWTTST